VYYVRCPDDAGSISFMDSRRNDDKYVPKEGEGAGKARRPFYEVKVKDGMLVVFPSWLTHYVNNTFGAEPRISIPINANFLDNLWGRKEPLNSDGFTAWGPFVSTTIFAKTVASDKPNSGRSDYIGVEFDKRPKEGKRTEVEYDGMTWEQYSKKIDTTFKAGKAQGNAIATSAESQSAELEPHTEEQPHTKGDDAGGEWNYEIDESTDESKDESSDSDGKDDFFDE